MPARLDPETIVALATPRGKGAIAIIRLSGGQSLKVLAAIWQSTKKQALIPRVMQLGWITVNGKRIDQALTVIARGPNSYTGEDTAEIHTHGSPAVIDMTIDACLSAGARLAEPGEFTKRAFLNGRLSAVQAEAVADLVDAESQALVRLAADQLAGGLDQKIAALQDRIVTLAAHEAAYLDFSEEDIDSNQDETLLQALDTIQADLGELLTFSSHVPVLRDGIKVALIGLPNAGKSTLLNALLGFERAIVSEIAGTTRDTVEEVIIINDVPIHLVDTAGLNTNPDTIEAIGIERSLVALRAADLVLILIEPGMTNQTATFIRQKQLTEVLHRKAVITLFTKTDETKQVREKQTVAKKQLTISAKTGAGLAELRGLIAHWALGGGALEGTLLTTKRQLVLVETARNHLVQAQTLIKQGAPRDIVFVELEEAARSLAMIHGTDIGEAMIQDMFQNFCIGK